MSSVSLFSPCFRKNYSHVIVSILRNLKNKILKRNSILDEVCDNEELSKKNFQLCNKYKYAKSNFYIISNLLLQKFNINPDDVHIIASKEFKKNFHTDSVGGLRVISLKEFIIFYNLEIGLKLV